MPRFPPFTLSRVATKLPISISATRANVTEPKVKEQCEVGEGWSACKGEAWDERGGKNKITIKMLISDIISIQNFHLWITKGGNPWVPLLLLLLLGRPSSATFSYPYPSSNQTRPPTSSSHGSRFRPCHVSFLSRAQSVASFQETRACLMPPPTPVTGLSGLTASNIFH